MYISIYTYKYIYIHINKYIYIYELPSKPIVDAWSENIGCRFLGVQKCSEIEIGFTDSDLQTAGNGLRGARQLLKYWIISNTYLYNPIILFPIITKFELS